MTARRELWEGVAESLRSAIVSGRIPSGSSLVEADLATRFQVSRGPIRDALREKLALIRAREAAVARPGLADIIARGRARRTLDERSEDEVLGYGADGLPA